MRMILRCAGFMLAACLGFGARATPDFHDANDLWITPFESGWGINIFHQGDTLFASLFVYGPDGKARWYTASNLVKAGTSYTGGLYESTGPALGTAFDPSRVTRRQVGSMSVELGTESTPQQPYRNYALVTYDVDGVRVVKKTHAFSFVALGLTGNYTGYQASTAGAKNEMTMNVTLENARFTMSTTSATSGSCTYSGTQDPGNGSLFNVLGSYSCGNGRSGNFLLRDVDVTRHGFTAKFSDGSTSMTEMVGQRTSGSIRGDGYSTDLWLNPNELGWGVNIVEQGDILFGTMFVYDAEGRPHWYSASHLSWASCAPPGSASECRGSYSGTVDESTGPYFGTAFNEASVKRTQVGSMKIDFYGDNTAYLTYTINGITVANKQLRRFAFRTNPLAGSYAGHITAQVSGDHGMQVGAMTIDVAESGDAITITMKGSRGTCTMRGNRSQYGRQVIAAGDYDCAGPAFGRMMLADVYVTSTGFTGWVDFGTDPGVNNFYTIGRIEAVRTAS